MTDSPPYKSFDPAPKTPELTLALEQILGALGKALETVVADYGRTEIFSLENISSGELARLVSLLGEGEISGKIEPAPDDREGTIHIRESVYPGIWLIGHRPPGSEGVVLSSIEIGRAPRILVRNPEPAPSLPLNGADLTDQEYVRIKPGLMNAPSLLEETVYHLGTYLPDRKSHRIFLNKLPLSEGDAEWIDKVCSGGHISLVSKGYGDCRILSTQVPGLWRVLYKNPEGVPLLDALCVTELPDEIAATPEDLVQSKKDYGEFLTWVRRESP